MPLDGAGAPLHTLNMPIAPAALVTAIADHLRAARPTWTVVVNGQRVQVAAEASHRLGARNSASVWVEDNRRRYSSEPGPEARHVDVAARGGLRRVTYKALGDLPALCRKVEARLAEGFAEEAARQERARLQAEADDRRAERYEAEKRAHPLAFAAHVWRDGGRLSIPDDLAAVALAAIEAHLRAQKEAAPPPEGEGAAQASDASEEAAG